MGSGFALGAWFAGDGLGDGASPTLVPATRGGAVFDAWAMDAFSAFDDRRDAMAPECHWWNGTVQYESPLCSHFSLSRVAAGSVDRAVDRAGRCAAAFETECVLAPEIGLGIPAAFVYDEEAASMRMLIAPRLLPHDGVPTELLVQDPAQEVGALARAFNRTIRAEYLPGGKRAPVTEVLANASSWCVQLLRQAMAAECWAQLD